MCGECSDILISVEEAICQLSVVIHVNDIQNKHASDLTSNHVALRDGFLLFELIEEVFSMLRAVPFELDGYDSCQMSLQTVRIDNGNDPLNCANSL